MDRFRESFTDDSMRGELYLDDRTELASVYDGRALVAILFDEGEVERYQNETQYDVQLTPAGIVRCGDGE